jgi:hypothetical protein
LPLRCLQRHHVRPHVFCDLGDPIEQNRFADTAQPQQHLAFLLPATGDALHGNRGGLHDRLPAGQLRRPGSRTG